MKFPFQLSSVAHLYATVALLLALLASPSANADSSQSLKGAKPNIIFILSDDLGWGDLGCYGQAQILTPNIDRLASEGMRFTNAYAGNSVCAPSRSCLMQGLHPGHAHVRGNAYKGYREGLFKKDVTVAEVLHEAGYATGLFGKWGLGLSSQPDAVPTNQGFDEFFGIRGGFIDNKSHFFLQGDGFHDLYEAPGKSGPRDRIFPK